MKAAILLLATAPLIAQDVRVSVFELFRPKVLEVRSEGNILEVSKRPIEDAAWHRLIAGDRVTGRGQRPVVFRVRVPGKIERSYFGVLRVDREANHLRAVVTMPLETAVGSIVASESVPGATLEALKAQAVVARSFLLSSLARHGAFDACDTTHCQFLKSPPAQSSAAARAARETEGLVLTFDGQLFQALYSAQCGGRTRTIEEAGWQYSAYPYFAVDCKTCRGKRVEGHRLGLCQRGATAMSAEGAKYDVILQHYFPGTQIQPKTGR